MRKPWKAGSYLVAAAALAVTFGLLSSGSATATPAAVTPKAVQPISAPSEFVPIIPVRLLDTRVPDVKQTLGPNGQLTLPIIGNFPGSAPANATAVEINVQAVPHDTLGGFLTVWPDGSGARPTASTLNLNTSGQVQNIFISIGLVTGDNALDIFNLAGSKDVVVDMDGYYVPPTGTAAATTAAVTPNAFCPRQPCRF